MADPQDSLAALDNLATLAKAKEAADDAAELATLRLKAAVAYYGPQGSALLSLAEIAEVVDRDLSRVSIWGLQVAENRPARPGVGGPGSRGPGLRDLILLRLGFDPLREYRHPNLADLNGQPAQEVTRP